MQHQFQISKTLKKKCLQNLKIKPEKVSIKIDAKKMRIKITNEKYIFSSKVGKTFKMSKESKKIQNI